MLQGGTSVEGVVTDACERFRQVHLMQTCAPVEGTIEFFHHGRDVDRGQAGTTMESAGEFAHIPRKLDTSQR